MRKDEEFAMRKMTLRAAILCAAVWMLGAFAGCGEGKAGEENSTETTNESTMEIVMKDLDVDQFVTLGDYKNLKVEKEEAKVSEEELKELVDQVYNDSFPAEMGITDRAVEVGDTANIDYEGKKDGVAFQGGTAQGSNLTIGSHTFIDGFEDGLVGVMPGETVDLNLTFPEIYSNPDLAGQDVVFTVKVNYIIPAEKTDEAVKQFGVESVTTVKELEEYLRDYLLRYEESSIEAEYETKLLNAFLESCEFHDIPEEYITAYRQKTEKNIETVATQMGTDTSTYIYYYYQMTLEDFLADYPQTALKQYMALQAVANRENLNVSDEELQKNLEEYAQAAGMASVEEYVGDNSMEDLREFFMYEKVYDYLKGIASK